jgi:D-aminopeptidase
VPDAPSADGTGSIIVIAATNAPLLPHQCTRLAQRCAFGIGRAGGAGEHTSGDLILAFATGNEGIEDESPAYALTALADASMSALFWAAVEATEEAIVNALVAAETMTGRDGITAHALPHDRLREVLVQYSRG